MGKALSNNPSYKWILISIKWLGSISMLAMWMAPAALMTVIMEDLNISISQAGLLLTVITAGGGIFSFVGSSVMAKIGTKRTNELGLWLLVIGGVVTFLSKSFIVLMLGRIIFSIGYGINTPANSGFMMSFFEGKQRSFVITAGGVFAALAQSIGLALTVPLYNLLGTWQSVLGIFCIVNAITAVLWTLLATDKEDEIVTKSDQQEKQKNPIVKALKNRAVLVLTIVLCGKIVAYLAFNTYFPTYFQTARGMSAETAGFITSLLPFVGMLGNALGGILTTKLGRRKIVVLIAGSGLFIGALGALLIPGGFGLIIFMCLIGFSNSLVVAPAQLIGMDEADSPAFAGAAMTLTFGFPQLLTIFTPFIFGGLSESVGMQSTFLVFCAPVLVCVLVAAIFLPETGPAKLKGTEVKPQ